MKTQKGTITKVIKDRGFGFLHGDGGEDLFFHMKGLVKKTDFEKLEVGTRVVYLVVAAPDQRRQAVDIVVEG